MCIVLWMSWPYIQTVSYHWKVNHPTAAKQPFQKLLELMRILRWLCMTLDQLDFFREDFMMGRNEQASMLLITVP